MSRAWNAKGPAGSSANIPIRTAKHAQNQNEAHLPNLGSSQASGVTQRKTVIQKSTPSTIQHMPAKSTAAHGFSQNITRMPSDKFLGFEAYSEGEIFCTLAHQPHYNQAFREGIDANDGYITVLGLPGAAVVYSKYRKFVVVARFAHHCVALPVFTHAGKGLNNKEDGFDLNEFVSIRDYQSKQTAAKTETPRYGKLWASQYRGFERIGFTGPMTDHTSVHISNPHCHNYSWPATKVAKLTEESTEKLRRLFTDSMLSATGGDKTMDLIDDDGFQAASSRKSNFTSNKSFYKNPASMRGRPTPRSLLPNYN